MRQKPMIMTPYNIQMSTTMAKKRIESTLRLADSLRSDPEKENRIKTQFCLCCYYYTAVAGQALTQRECGICGEDQMYGNTNADALCISCAKENSLCKHCGGDLDLRDKRRNFPDISKIDS